MIGPEACEFLVKPTPRRPGLPEGSTGAGLRGRSDLTGGRMRGPPGRCGVRQHGGTIVEALGVLAILAILLTLLLPALLASRQAARQARCQLNLRGWGQAVQAYLAARGQFPPAATWREGQPRPGGPLVARHSLFTYLLPYCDHGALAQRIDLQRDWNDPRNAPWTRQELGGILICPAAPTGRFDKQPTDYTTAVRVDPSTRSGLGRLLLRGAVRDRSGQGPPHWGAGRPVWRGLLALDTGAGPRSGRSTRLRHVADGTTHTLLLFENGGKPICYRDGRRATCHITRFRWASPTIWMAINDVCRGQQLINCHNNSQPYSFHTGGMQALFADGSVRWITEQIAPDVFVSAVTPAARD